MNSSIARHLPPLPDPSICKEELTLDALIRVFEGRIAVTRAVLARVARENERKRTGGFAKPTLAEINRMRADGGEHGAPGRIVRSKGVSIMATSLKSNRVQQLAAEQKLIDGTKQFLMQVPTIMVGSQTMTPAEIISVVQGRIDKGHAAAAAADARTAAVKADRDERQKTAPVLKAFTRIVIGMFMQSPDTLGAFGLKAPKVAQKTVADKAAAADKAIATKKARGPIGRIQRSKVHAVAPAPVAAPTAAGATAAPATVSPAPAPSAAPNAGPVTPAPHGGA
jgi:hypothetical protein